jgi:hypothetical protein
MDALRLSSTVSSLKTDLQTSPAITTQKSTTGFAGLTSAISESWGQFQMQSGMLNSSLGNVIKSVGDGLATVARKG